MPWSLDQRRRGSANVDPRHVDVGQLLWVERLPACPATPAPAPGASPATPPAPNAAAPAGVPAKAEIVLNQVKSTGGNPPAGYRGGSPFLNEGRNGGQVLPRTDASGNGITYREYDVNPFTPGVNRGAERIVMGSDGKAYYTNNHYTTFTPVP